MSRLSTCFVLAAALALSAFVPAHRAATISLTNASSSTIIYLYASRCNEAIWGADLLDVDILEPGAGAEITLEAGCWDLRAVAYGDGEFLRYGQQVADGGAYAWRLVD